MHAECQQSDMCLLLFRIHRLGSLLLIPDQICFTTTELLVGTPALSTTAITGNNTFLISPIKQKNDIYILKEDMFFISLCVLGCESTIFRSINGDIYLLAAIQFFSFVVIAIQISEFRQSRRLICQYLQLQLVSL